MTVTSTVEVDFPEELDQEQVAHLNHCLDVYRPDPGVTSIGLITLGGPPTRTVQFVCQGDRSTQADMDSLAMVIVTDTLEDAGFNPGTLRIHTV
ncbi:hypothetical protein [Streptacidiphilus neutrinimicus]|uniref:hypothetical protein n=1 Tax=Streptacidiphilus neutrinimicus TaxID=105420 RepID=UPI0005A73AEA|nr:hypothetical protein [Streptacidiphilus neutrinimicus]